MVPPIVVGTFFVFGMIIKCNFPPYNTIYAIDCQIVMDNWW